MGGAGQPGPGCGRERPATLDQRVRLGSRAGLPWPGQLKPEQQEIDRLQREVAKLKAERDILKKAAAYLARKSI